MAANKDPSDTPDVPTPLMTLHLEITGKEASDVRLKWDVDPRVVTFSDRQELILAGLAAITNNMGRIVNT